MSLNLKEKLLKLLSTKEEKQNQLTLTETELNELIEKRANELLDAELATLDKAFLKEVSGDMKSIKVDETTKEDKTQEEKVREILTNNSKKE